MPKKDDDETKIKYRDLLNGFLLLELREKMARQRGFTDPDIMDVFNQEKNRNYENRPDYAEEIELFEKGEEDDDI
jgi:hypothetical protein